MATVGFHIPWPIDKDVTFTIPDVPTTQDIADKLKNTAPFNTIKDISDKVVNLATVIGDGAANPGTIIKQITDAVANIDINPDPKVTTKLSDAINTVTDGVAGIPGKVQGTVDAAQGVITGAVTTTEGVITKAVTTTEGVITGAVTATQGVITGAVSTVEGEVKALPKEVYDAFVSTLKSAGVDVDAILKELANAASDINNLVSSGINPIDVVNGLKKIINFNGVSSFSSLIPSFSLPTAGDFSKELTNLKNIVPSVPSVTAAFKNLSKPDLSGITGKLGQLTSPLIPDLTKEMSHFTNPSGDGILSSIKRVKVPNIPSLDSGLSNFKAPSVDNIISRLKQLVPPNIGSFEDQFKSKFSNFNVPSISVIEDSLKRIAVPKINAFDSAFNDFKNTVLGGAKSLIKTITPPSLDELKNSVTKLTTPAINFSHSLFDGVSNAFGKIMPVVSNAADYVGKALADPEYLTKAQSSLLNFISFSNLWNNILVPFVREHSKDILGFLRVFYAGFIVVTFLIWQFNLYYGLPRDVPMTLASWFAPSALDQLGKNVQSGIKSQLRDALKDDDDDSSGGQGEPSSNKKKKKEGEEKKTGKKEKTAKPTKKSPKAPKLGLRR